MTKDEMKRMYFRLKNHNKEKTEGSSSTIYSEEKMSVINFKILVFPQDAVHSFQL